MALPSPGIHTAPARSSVRRIGAIVPASARRDELELDAEASSPAPSAASSAASRSGVLATFRLPHCFQPVASPVSCFERRVQLDAVTAHPRRVARRARLADEPRGVPRRAAGEPALLEQHDVGDAELGQVVGGRDAGDAAADDDDARVRGNRAGMP